MDVPQTADGHDMDHYADDLAALTANLDLWEAIHVGHSTGGGEVVHYLARYGEARVAKAVILSAVPPLMLKTSANPGVLAKEVFDGLQAQLAANRSQFYYEIAAGPFYGYNRPGAKHCKPTGAFRTACSRPRPTPLTQICSRFLKVQREQLRRIFFSDFTRCDHHYWRAAERQQC
jgi:pimeloyl-ACP methyl ester carboxylesterase